MMSLEHCYEFAQVRVAAAAQCPVVAYSAEENCEINNIESRIRNAVRKELNHAATQKKDVVRSAFYAAQKELLLYNLRARVSY